MVRIGFWDDAVGDAVGGNTRHVVRMSVLCVCVVYRVLYGSSRRFWTHGLRSGFGTHAMLNDAVGGNTRNSVRMSVVCVCVVYNPSRPEAHLRHTSHVNWFTTDNSSRKSAPVYARRPCEGRRVRATLRVWVKGAPQIGCRADGQPKWEVILHNSSVK